MIELKGVSKNFSGRTAVNNISLQANDNEVLVLLGTSGCGKTTTLKMINRLIEPDSGSIFIGGKDITLQNPEVLRKNIGFVMQHSGLFPHYNVRDNIAMVPDLLQWDKKKTDHRIAALIEKLHLQPDILTLFPNELSGGQQQRVGIARALVANTPVLLMDEPFGALDTITKASIHKEFKALEELRQKTIVMVTHDVQEAFELGDRICLMDKGEIIQVATPEQMLYNPVNDFVRQFLDGYRLLLEHKVTKLSNIQQFLPGHIMAGVPLHTTVWAALEQFNATDTEAYDKVAQAYTQYRKTRRA